jgi:hypothetical protein
MPRTPTPWAYATNPAAEGRDARGFVLATSATDARKKARQRLAIERKAFAKWANMPVSSLPRLYVTTFPVWPDPEFTTAPQAGRYFNGTKVVEGAPR